MRCETRVPWDELTGSSHGSSSSVQHTVACANRKPPAFKAESSAQALLCTPFPFPPQATRGCALWAAWTMRSCAASGAATRPAAWAAATEQPTPHTPASKQARRRRMAQHLQQPGALGHVWRGLWRVGPVAWQQQLLLNLSESRSVPPSPPMQGWRRQRRQLSGSSGRRQHAGAGHFVPWRLALDRPGQGGWAGHCGRHDPVMPAVRGGV